MEVAPFLMEVAPFFVDFHHFLSIFTIFYRFSRFTHFCRDLHFVAIYTLFPQIFFGQNSLLRNITRFLHVWAGVWPARPSGRDHEARMQFKRVHFWVFSMSRFTPALSSDWLLLFKMFWAFWESLFLDYSWFTGGPKWQGEGAGQEIALFCDIRGSQLTF